jgi:uracil-DNA glycosylase
MNSDFDTFKSLIPQSWIPIFNVDDLYSVYTNLCKESIIKPNINKIFRCFKYFKPNDIRVVILGQDPYQSSDHADGLCFSSKNKEKIPASLKNVIIEIFKEYKMFDMLSKINTKHINTELDFLAKQNVLLMNTILTVGSAPMTHKNIGWDLITNNIIKEISLMNNNIVFLMFGQCAHSKINLINNKEQHYIIKTSHPSYYSYNMDGLDKYDPFANSMCFIKCNTYLESNKLKPIDWHTGFIKPS